MDDLISFFGNLVLIIILGSVTLWIFVQVLYFILLSAKPLLLLLGVS